ncbi:MAG: hypothetical protein P4L28_00025 [Paludibacteraceae bacterium]|nr:hypothetical protein [Paludibacteraceae bacterium]
MSTDNDTSASTSTESTPNTSPVGVLGSSIKTALATGSDTNSSDKNTQAKADRENMAKDIAKAIETYLTSRPITFTLSAPGTAGSSVGPVSITGPLVGTIS